MCAQRNCSCGQSRPDSLDEFDQFGAFSDVSTLDDAADWAEADEMEDALDSDVDADQFVFGPDDRFQVRAQARHPSTTLFPFNTICRIQNAAGGDVCTGTLIAPQVVLTARHCLVVDPGSPSCGPIPATRRTVPAGAVRVSPGWDQSQRPGRRSNALPNSMIAPAASQFAHPRVDIGLIIMPRPFRRPTRFMLLQPRGHAETVNRGPITLAGYPGDMPAGTMWAHSDRIRAHNATHFFHQIDMCPGQSGGPMWILDRGPRPTATRVLIAVQSVQRQRSARRGQVNCGVRIAGQPVHNCGVRLTCDVIQWILATCRRRVRTLPNVDRPTFQRCPRPGRAA